MIQFAKSTAGGVRRSPRFLGLLLLASASAAALAATTPYQAINRAAASDPITVQRLRGGVSMLSGSGGNIGVLSTAEGALLGDAGIAVSRSKILHALKGLGVRRLIYVVNTHWHWDHTDGNLWVHKLGAKIIGTRSTARRLSATTRIVEWGHTFQPVDRAARPAIFVDGPKTLKLGAEEVLIRPYSPGHTDTDLSIYFRKADVLQTGDSFWNGVYPFIDYVGGGSIDGAIREANRNIAMAGRRTIVIPGHGPVGNRSQLVAFRDMLVTVRGRVAALKRAGKSASQTVAARPTASFDDEWGRSVIDGALFTRLVYRGV